MIARSGIVATLSTLEIEMSKLRGLGDMSKIQVSIGGGKRWHFQQALRHLNQIIR
jgi:hypothetical protein